ncbi:MAG: transporter substrate-binding domain-containing protein [Chloroflexi bacterium]|nr:transporter substrate-binding domain-containing protein [Chloroflexota bacterium]
MTRSIFFAAALLCLAFGIATAQPGPVATLVPPTPVPYNTTATSETALSESGIKRIVDTGRVRVGILYTEPPFGTFTERGELLGLDAVLAQSFADLWGVELRLRQVTRQTAFELLQDNDVDMLIAAQVHRRELDRAVDYSQAYYVGSQSLMVRVDDGAQAPSDLASRRIGVVLGSEAEIAIRAWAAETGFAGAIETYLTVDRVYGALGAAAVDAIVAPRHQLEQLALLAPDTIRILDEPIQSEPYAVVVPRQDLPLRRLIDQSLQHLQRESSLDQIRRDHFNQGTFSVVPVWANLPESPSPEAFSADIPYPTTYTIPRLQTNGVVRVAGPFLDNNALAAAQQSERRLDRFNRDFVAQLTRSWNVTVELITADPADAARLVAEGGADMAVGLEPDWNLAAQVDFSEPYLLRGTRLMVKANSQIFGFEELRGGGTVATVFSEPGAAADAVRQAERATARIEGFQTDESSLALQILDDLNADVAYADIFKLMAHLEAYPNDLRLTDDWYSRSYYAVALPLNDADFRLLVDYSIQALAEDGTLRQLWNGLLPADEPIPVEIVPGPDAFLGYVID